MDFFTKKHFELLSSYQGKKYDNTKNEHIDVYTSLKEAYKITEKWANSVYEELFQNNGGYFKIIKKPISQGGKFYAYNWARFYPAKDSPIQLAYTVGISTNYSRVNNAPVFIVKIDTVGLDETDPIRVKYLNLKNILNIDNTLPMQEGLDMGLLGLIRWSIDSINNFNDYADVVTALGINNIANVAIPILNEVTESKETFKVNENFPLNQILFGPPGTGKTFSTIDEALRILDTNFLEENENNRIALKVRFDQLVSERKIRFTTFHQSFSYEDFVEGLVAVTTPANQIEYTVQPGVFQQLCIDSANFKLLKSKHLESVNTDEDVSNAIKKFKEFTLDQSIDLYTTKNPSKFSVIYQTKLDQFNCTVAEGNEYKIKPENIYKFLTESSVNNNEYPSYVAGISLFIQNNFLNPKNQYGEIGVDRFVLIIDEINRGNISKIFGELITLIEPSKRIGAEEALTVTLPYSKNPFGIPSNVYIIGTMNTADRSLTGLDIALRRRFTFKEMPPKPELLDDVVVEGINIGKLLEIMNQRIEVLLDRDHCIGHAYFMPLRDDKRLTKLGDIFKRQIMPLLQEYFFDDYERIAWVLNDGSSNSIPFIKMGGEQALNKLFASQVAEKLKDSRWSINASAFVSKTSYLNIIGDNN